MVFLSKWLITKSEGEMKKYIVLLLLFFSISSNAALSPLEYVTAPKGNMVYYIMGDRNPEEGEGGGVAITSMNQKTGSKTTLLEERITDKPEENLFGFYDLKLSIDGKTLYFQTPAWATSSAIHSLDIENKKQSFVTDGSLICVISNGQYQDYLLIQQHRYFVHQGSYDHYYLYNKKGEKIGLVSDAEMNELQLLKACQSLG